MKKQANWNGLSEIELCYFAALIDGLRLINEKAQYRKINRLSLDSGALIDYVQEKGQQILVAVQSERKTELREILSADRKMRYGRSGIPEPIAQAMIEEYRRTNSLAKTAMAFSRTRQSMWAILRRRIGLNRCHRILHHAILYNGRKFTPCKGGYLRLTTSGGRKTLRERGGEVLLHRIVWTDAHGPIPPDHQVMFRDGDRRNCWIENLFCKSRREASLGRKSSNDWTKFYNGLGPRPVTAVSEREKIRASLRRTWANYTPAQKKHRCRGIHRRWRERQQRIAA